MFINIVLYLVVVFGEIRNFGDCLLNVDIGPILTEMYLKISSEITGPV